MSSFNLKKIAVNQNIFIFLFQLIYWLCQLELVILNPNFTKNSSEQLEVLKEFHRLRVQFAFFNNSIYRLKIESHILTVGSYAFAPKMAVQFIDVDQPLNLSMKD